MGDKINIRTVYDGKQEAESISDEIESYQRNKNSINNAVFLVELEFQTKNFRRRRFKNWSALSSNRWFEIL